LFVVGCISSPQQQLLQSAQGGGERDGEFATVLRQVRLWSSWFLGLLRTVAPQSIDCWLASVTGMDLTSDEDKLLKNLEIGMPFLAVGGALPAPPAR
jgi:hypothetical protein